ncbi:MAG: hypothetical protein M3332_02225, partial [Actinomycetota bacterium]|nr:hypothetical protein [Actinomycetota bacterium]
MGVRATCRRRGGHPHHRRHRHLARRRARGDGFLAWEQARTIGRLLDLDDEILRALQLPPVRGAGVVDPTEPTIYRLQEMVQVYGSALAELIREEFGDGIMSAID